MDAMTRCSHGHFYDASKHSSCPYCGAGTDIEGKTRRVPSSPAAQQPKAAPPPPASDPGVTRAVYRETATGISPVVGWLVCVAGPDRGRDYRIHGEKNFIGRGSSMDIVIAGDGLARKARLRRLRSQEAQLLAAARRGIGTGLSQ